MAPPPLLLNAGFDAGTVVPVVPVVPLLAGWPKLSGTPVGGGVLFVGGVVAEPCGPVGVGVGVAPEAAVTVGTLSVIPLCAQSCAKPVPKANQTGMGRNEHYVDMSCGRTDEGWRTKNGKYNTQPDSNRWLFGSWLGSTETTHSMQAYNAFMFGLVQAHSAVGQFYEFKSRGDSAYSSACANGERGVCVCVLTLIVFTIGTHCESHCGGI